MQDTLHVAIDVTANGKLPLSPHDDDDSNQIFSVEMFLYSYDTGRNFTISNGTATANNASLGEIMAQEPGSTVKHVNWIWPDCLVGDGEPEKDSDRGVYNVSRLLPYWFQVSSQPDLTCYRFLSGKTFDLTGMTTIPSSTFQSLLPILSQKTTAVHLVMSYLISCFHRKRSTWRLLTKWVSCLRQEMQPSLMQVTRTQKGLFWGRIWWHMLELRACSWLCFSNIVVFCVVIRYLALAITFLFCYKRLKKS
jgi:hypothetical protein